MTGLAGWLAARGLEPLHPARLRKAAQEHGPDAVDRVPGFGDKLREMRQIVGMRPPRDLVAAMRELAGVKGPEEYTATLQRLKADRR